MANFLDNNTWGIYAPPAPFPDCGAHMDIEQLIGVKLPMLSWFTNWSLGMPRGAQWAAEGGYELQICWLPQLNGGAPIPFKDILNGWWDGYIDNFFTAAGRHPKPVTIRFAHEPNVGIYPWSVNRNESCVSTEQYIATWRYVAGRLARLGLHPKVQLMWCMATSDKGGIPMEAYWPGAAYVGKFGIDIYNGHGARRWWEARQLIKPWYDRFLQLGNQPIWIGELGCREPSKDEVSNVADPTQSKAAWLNNLFNLEEFPRITHTSFFHAERTNDWRLDSSPEALAAVRSAMKKRYPKELR